MAGLGKRQNTGETSFIDNVTGQKIVQLGGLEFPPRKVWMKTFGCQMNYHDSERILSHLKDLNFSQTEEKERADLILFNTCAIRDLANTKFYSQLGEIKHNKKKELYRGVTEIDSESLEQGILQHLKQSTQVLCDLKIAIVQDEKGEIIRALGLLLEKMPVESLGVTAEIFEEYIKPLSCLSPTEVIDQIDARMLLGHELEIMCHTV